jgi:hypothetical protein
VSRGVTVVATCVACGEEATFPLSGITLVLYVRDVQAIQFACPLCEWANETLVSQDVADGLVDVGVQTRVVVAPGELLRWPDLEVPPISEHEVGVLERSSVEHFNERLRVEL